MNTQLVPPSDAILSEAPSGRDIYSTKSFLPPNLDEEVLARMRAPPEVDESVNIADDDSSGEEGKGKKEPPGSFSGDPTSEPSGDPYY